MLAGLIAPAAYTIEYDSHSQCGHSHYGDCRPLQTQTNYHFRLFNTLFPPLRLSLYLSLSLHLPLASSPSPFISPPLPHLLYLSIAYSSSLSTCLLSEVEPESYWPHMQSGCNHHLRAKFTVKQQNLWKWNYFVRNQVT